MSVEQILPYVGVVSLTIVVGGLLYNFGKWRQKNETDKEEIKKKRDMICTKIDNIPKEFLPVFIDMYKIYEKMKEEPEVTKKEGRKR